jgi:hypothetical protein
MDAARQTWEVLDFSLFMYGLVRGDVVEISQTGPAYYHELKLYELDGVWRIGIPYVEKNRLLTVLSGLVTASKVEFSVKPEDDGKLQDHGVIAAVRKSALRGIV